MSERGRRPDAEPNSDPNPWDVLGIPENPLLTNEEKKKAAIKRLAELWEERTNSPEAKEEYILAWQAWNKIKDNMESSATAGSPSNPAEAGDKNKAENGEESFEKRKNAAAEAKKNALNAATEKGKGAGASLKGFIKNHGILGTLVLTATVALVSRFFSSGETVNAPAASKPAAAAPENKLPKSEVKPQKEEEQKKENDQSVSESEEDEGTDKNEEARKKFEKIFHKDRQRPSAERQNMPEESAQEQPEINVEEIERRETFEENILKDFTELIPGCIVQSGGNGYYVIELSRVDGGKCFVAGPKSFTGERKNGKKSDGFDEIKMKYTMDVRGVQKRYAPFLENARGDLIREKAVHQNIDEHLEPAKLAVHRKMLKVLKEQCVEIPQDQVSKTFDRAREMRGEVEKKFNEIKSKAEKNSNERLDPQKMRQRSYRDSEQRNQSYKDRTNRTNKTRRY